MAILETKRCLERRLMTLAPAIPTAFEGVSFDPPATMYQRVQLMVKKPADPTLGVGYHRDEMQLQVFIVDAASTNSGLNTSTSGTNITIARAELTREHFKKGTTFEEGAFRIHILTTPTVGSSAQVGTRTIIPVLIDVITEVYS